MDVYHAPYPSMTHLDVKRVLLGDRARHLVAHDVRVRLCAAAPPGGGGGVQFGARRETTVQPPRDNRCSFCLRTRTHSLSLTHTHTHTFSRDNHAFLPARAPQARCSRLCTRRAADAPRPPTPWSARRRPPL